MLLGLHVNRPGVLVKQEQALVSAQVVEPMPQPESDLCKFWKEIVDHCASMQSEEQLSDIKIEKMEVSGKNKGCHWCDKTNLRKTCSNIAQNPNLVGHFRRHADARKEYVSRLCHGQVYVPPETAAELMISNSKGTGIGADDKSVLLSSKQLKLFRRVRDSLLEVKIPFIFVYGTARSLYLNKTDVRDVDIAIHHSHLQKLGSTTDEILDRLEGITNRQELVSRIRVWRLGTGSKVSKKLANKTSEEFGNDLISHMKFSLKEFHPDLVNTTVQMDVYVLFGGEGSDDRVWDCPLLLRGSKKKCRPKNHMHLPAQIPICWSFPRMNISNFTEAVKVSFDSNDEYLAPMAWLETHYGPTWQNYTRTRRKRINSWLRHDAKSLVHLPAEKWAIPSKTTRVMPSDYSC